MASENQSLMSSHHARRPMNAFLIFCKRHRNVVKDRYPNLENRCITKILGEWWAGLDCAEKSDYTNLAKQYKDAFFTANPDFKWYKLPAPPLRMLSARPENPSIFPPSYVSNSNITSLNQSEIVDSEYQKLNLEQINTYIDTDVEQHDPENDIKLQTDEELKQMFSPGKLADETQLGGLRNLIKGEIYNNNNENNNHEDLNKRDVFNSFNKFANLNNNVSHAEDLCAYKNNNELEHALHEANSFISNVFDEHCTMDSKQQFLYDGPKIRYNKLNRAENIKHSYDNAVIDVKKDINLDVHYKSPDFHECINSKVPICEYEPDNIHERTCELYLREKTSRSCKGKRYEEFKIKGLINIKPKHSLNNKSNIYLSYNAGDSIKSGYNKSHAAKPNEATDGNILGFVKKVKPVPNDYNENINRFNNAVVENRTYRDQMDPSTLENKFFHASDFDLDGKIMALPLLNLDEYLLKKKENKNIRKRIRKHGIDGTSNESQYKNKIYTINKLKAMRRNNFNDSSGIFDRETAIGSKKRKATKQRITHLEIRKPNIFDLKYRHVMSHQNNYLSDLSTLAEVAAKSSKIATTVD